MDFPVIVKNSSPPPTVGRQLAATLLVKTMKLQSFGNYTVNFILYEKRFL